MAHADCMLERKKGGKKGSLGRLALRWSRLILFHYNAQTLGTAQLVERYSRALDSDLNGITQLIT
jgi:hypothetical protein